MSRAGHDRCWAQTLGDCDGGISGEHLVSNSFFSSDRVSVHGLSWCKAVPVEIGINSAVRNVLCRSHNSRLTPADAAGAAYMRGMRDYLRALALPSNAFFSRSVTRTEISGFRFESWLLKTLINVTFAGPHWIGPGATEAGAPGADLVKIAYGLDRFHGTAGLYLGGMAGANWQLGETLSFSPLLQDGVRIIGGLFTVSGAPMYLSLETTGMVPLGAIPALSPEWRLQDMHHHVRKIVGKIGQYPSNVIRFDWRR